MATNPDHPPRDVDNRIVGNVSGVALQIGFIEGGVHLHHHDTTRRPVVEEFPAIGLPDAAWLMAQPSRLLDARARLVPFQGRGAELRRLDAWRDARGARMSVLLLHAPGGQGKTRLAAEFAEWSRDPALPVDRRWLVLQAGMRGTPDAAIPEQVGAGVLLIVDYADRWAHSELENLFTEAVLNRSHPTRVLLIGRTVRWFAALRGVLAEQQAAVDDLALTPLTDDRLSMFHAARDRFAEPDLYDLSDGAAVEPPGSLAHPDFGLTLTVHMAALAAVDAYRRGARPPTAPHALSAYLLDREQLAWQRLYDAGARGQDYRTRPAVMARTVFTAVLTGPVDHNTATAALGALDLPGHPQDLLLDHRFCYPPADRDAMLEPLYPDRLAEDFLALLTPGHDVSAYDPDSWAGGVPELLLSPDSGVRATIASRAMTFLAAAAERWPHVGERVLFPLLNTDPGLAVEAGSAALVTLAGVDRLPTEVLYSVNTLLPGTGHSELDIGAAAISDVLTDRLLSGTTTPRLRAILHSNHSARLAAVGRYDEALDHSERALHHETGLAGPDRSGLNLRHSTALADVGRRQEALEFARRAAAIDRDLVTVDRGAHLASLGHSLNGYANNAAAVGRISEAVEHSRQAVELADELVAANRAEHLASLAAYLRNHAQHLAQADRDEESAVFSARAVDLQRELVEHDRAAHLIELAGAIGTHAKRLTALGRQREALDLAREALALAEELVQANRAAHLIRLAIATEEHASLLMAAQRWDECLRASYRSVELTDELVTTNHSLHLPLLGAALLKHAQRLGSFGTRPDAPTWWQDDALANTRRAVEVFDELVEVDRAKFTSLLATALLAFYMTRALLAAERDEATRAGDRVKALLRGLVEADPEYEAKANELIQMMSVVGVLWRRSR